jgi:TolB-like protein/Tfp pilus assembly protein PilF
MSEPSRAVFLSYASQDAEAARRICEALRSAGIEVWFDQSELRGGDVWDNKIRQQIHDCALFVPVISSHTDERTEGYFRLEWKLAVDRSHLMADDAAFLVPAVIDGASEESARVPDKFHTLQWTRLPGGETPEAFCRWIKALLSGTARPVRRPADSGTTTRRHSNRALLIAAIAAPLLAAIGLLAWRAMNPAPKAAPASQPAAASPASAIPEHSIAVLPFANLSAQREEEYFSDGLAEDLLNLLSKVPGLQVAARASAFSFKGQAVDVPTMGRQLKVASVLEGTVRKVGKHLRVTARLERAADGYQIWSETYDRELGDVFRMQDEIANAVVKSLKVSLLLGASPRNPGTQNSEAYLLFLQGRAKMGTQRLADTRAAAADFEHVLKLDPNYAPAYVELATAKVRLAEFEVTSNRVATANSAIEESKLLIERALALDPSDGQAYVERGYLRAFSDNAGAEQDYRRGIELNPNSARGYAGLAGVLFQDPLRRDESLAMVEQARRLDPLAEEYDVLKANFFLLGRGNLREADALLVDVVARHPLYKPGFERLALVRRAEGNFADAIMYEEQALKLDPLDEWSRRMLIVDYADIGDLVAAREVSAEAPHKLPIQRLALLIAAGNWREAAEVTYAAIADGTAMPVGEPNAVFALRMDAHRTGNFARARLIFEQMSGVTWSAEGIPALPAQLGFAYASVGLGDMLISSGERTRGERLLRASLADMDHVAHDLKRGEFWYVIDKATALALLGDYKATLAALRKAVAMGYVSSWSLIELDPAFDALRTDPEFQTLMRAINDKQAHERQILEQMRADGRVPDRNKRNPTAPKA